MAEAFVNHLAKTRRIEVVGESAGTIVGEKVNPIAVQVMSEIGISMKGQSPKQLVSEMGVGTFKTITMGCGGDAAACPARVMITEDWGLDDPAGQPIEKVREIRDQIEARVESLLDEVEKG